ncbi:MAG TPA: MFS transporter [Xanthobacteraceae bacterium]|nr:MFS transporter [Xanthobacteraceae bacterium]
MSQHSTASPSVISVVNDAELKSVHFKVIVIAAFGLIFDGYDFQATAYAAPLIRQEWQLDPRVLGGLISAGFLGLFVGSIGASYLADLIGRKRAFALCTIIYSIFTAAAAFAPGFESFVGLRFLTGIGLGGVIPIATAWVFEMMPSRNRAAITAAVVACFLFGWIVASVAALFIIPDFGWRAFFFLGAVPAILGVFLLFTGPESPIWLLSRGRLAEANRVLQEISPGVKLDQAAVASFPRSRSNWLKLMSSQWLKSTIIFGIMYFMLAVLSAGITQWLPTLLVGRGITLHNTYLYTFVVSAGPMIGSIVMGALLDVIGRRRAFVVFWVCASAFIVAFAFATSPAGVMGLGFGLTFFSIATYTCLDVIVAELFPTELRASAIGWGLGMSRLGGAVGPVLGGYLVSFGISYTGFFLVFAVPPLINIILSPGIAFAKSRPQLLH